MKKVSSRPPDDAEHRSQTTDSSGLVSVDESIDAIAKEALEKARAQEAREKAKRDLPDL